MAIAGRGQGMEEVAAAAPAMADLNKLCENLLARRSLILSSNRGPVEHHVTPDGRAEARRGGGGIVTALNSLAQTAQFTWIASAMGEGDRLISGGALGSYYPSPLPGHKINLRYVVTPAGLSQVLQRAVQSPALVLAALYVEPALQPNVDASIHDAWQGGYVPVNQAFARLAVEQARADRRPPVFIGHDYHLYLMPEYLRQEIPDALIQHFIHIPWPTPRYWQMIPSYITRQICSALSSADLLGFQTPQDRRSFLDTVEEFVPDAQVDRQQAWSFATA